MNITSRTCLSVCHSNLVPQIECSSTANHLYTCSQKEITGTEVTVTMRVVFIFPTNSKPIFMAYSVWKSKVHDI